MCVFRPFVLFVFIIGVVVVGCGGDEGVDSPVGPSPTTTSYRTLDGGGTTPPSTDKGTVIYGGGRGFRGATPLDQLTNPLAGLVVTQQPGEDDSQGGTSEIEPTRILDPLGAGEGDGSGIEPTRTEDAAGNPIDPVDGGVDDDSSGDDAVSHNADGGTGNPDDDLEPTNVLDDDGGGDLSGNDSGDNSQPDDGAGDDDDGLWADGIEEE